MKETCEGVPAVQVRMLATRVNTVNKRVYGADPTVFAWELCNECHTSDNYELDNNGIVGQLLYDWQARCRRRQWEAARGPLGTVPGAPCHCSSPAVLPDWTVAAGNAESVDRIKSCLLLSGLGNCLPTTPLHPFLLLTAETELQQRCCNSGAEAVCPSHIVASGATGNALRCGVCCDCAPLRRCGLYRTCALRPCRWR